MKWLKLFHIIFAIAWIGCAFGMNLLKFFVHPDGAQQMYMLSLDIWMLDQLLICAGVMGCLLTGLIYGFLTKWGFFKHRWLIWKWVLTIIMILLGTFVMGPAVDGNVKPIEWYNTNLADYTQNMDTTALWGSIQLILLILVVWLSVFKPNKKAK